MKSREIAQAKEKFNGFFQKDLYGRFDDPENIILSRGAWNDETVVLPQLFRFCINYTLDRRWIGYSDSLGHDRVFESLERWANIDGGDYTHENFGLTLGNVATMGFVFKELKGRYPEGVVLTTEPYYPSIAKAVSEHFPEIETVSGLEHEEQQVLEAIKSKCDENNSVKILLLSNFLGVEGRIYSQDFWEQIFAMLEEKDLFLVIDEGLWFDRINYPDSYDKNRIVRAVSPSKKYGNPGMKMGHLLGPKDFMEGYYERASTGYGGPASIFFLASEFLYQFEYALSTGDKGGFSMLAKRYEISETIINELYEDFVATMCRNHDFYKGNRAVFERWIDQTDGVIKNAYRFGGINFFIEPFSSRRAYDIFLDLIQQKGVSIFPSICLGDMTDRRFRLTILEKREDMVEGLNRLAEFLEREPV